MNGCVIPGTPIAVDSWKIRECGEAKLFFLTHLHGDHVVGLTSSWNKPIYCSEITSKILTSRYEIKPDLVNSLSENESHLIPINTSCDDQEYVTVTVVDAKHCPGAVMFLFEGHFGKILHTGDFRFSESMIEDSLLKNHLGSIDVLYLDNTYCHPSCVFPSRDQVTQSIIALVNTYKDYDVVFGLRNLGKEEMLVKVALACKEWISIPSSMMEVARILNLPDVFVVSDNPMSCRLRVLPFTSISAKFVAKMNLTKPTIAILPTALYTGLNVNVEPFGKSEHVFVVPYSDHSSYAELLQFVSCVKPSRVVPIVRSDTHGPYGADFSARADMSCFDHLLKIKSTPERATKYRKLQNGSKAKIRLFKENDGFDIRTDHKSKTKRFKRIVRRGLSKVSRKGVTYDSDVSEVAEKSNSPPGHFGDRETERDSNQKSNGEIPKSDSHLAEINTNDNVSCETTQEISPGHFVDKTTQNMNQKSLGEILKPDDHVLELNTKDDCFSLTTKESLGTNSVNDTNHVCHVEINTKNNVFCQTTRESLATNSVKDVENDQIKEIDNEHTNFQSEKQRSYISDNEVDFQPIKRNLSKCSEPNVVISADDDISVIEPDVFEGDSCQTKSCPQLNGTLVSDKHILSVKKYSNENRSKKRKRFYSVLDEYLKL
ncbi:5' exonuclease Apollo [Patella vulgata]|uniref:5' exonuclease Apollo n=1 Tax=Patella vulgata TaxID=6465 RepID=UPI0021807E30|nr:5' exonuclease Apollo [Patella vulgata]